MDIIDYRHINRYKQEIRNINNSGTKKFSTSAYVYTFFKDTGFFIGNLLLWLRPPTFLFFQKKTGNDPLYHPCWDEFSVKRYHYQLWDHSLSFNEKKKGIAVRGQALLITGSIGFRCFPCLDAPVNCPYTGI